MASKNNGATLVDMQDDDDEINLQFQDFGTNDTSLAKDDRSEHTIYFNSFPDSAEDDQEQKLLGEDGDDDPASGPSGPVHSFWTFEFYQQFFNVESKQVGDRIIWSMVPKPGVNFLQSYIRPNPDLYGPFWICVTLVFTTAMAGNLSSYLQAPGNYRWRYDFHKVTLASSCIFSYAWLVPVLVWALLLWVRRGAAKASGVSLLELVCLYGYSLAIFVPVSLLWMIPLRWLQWCLGIVAAVLSGGVLVRTLLPAMATDARKVAFGLALLIVVLHATLALGFMLYFFYPPIAKPTPLTIPLNNTANASDAVSDLKQGNESLKEEAGNAGVKKVVNEPGPGDGQPLPSQDRINKKSVPKGPPLPPQQPRVQDQPLDQKLSLKVGNQVRDSVSKSKGSAATITHEKVPTDANKGTSTQGKQDKSNLTAKEESTNVEDKKGSIKDEKENVGDIKGKENIKDNKENIGEKKTKHNISDKKEKENIEDKKVIKENTEDKKNNKKQKENISDKKVKKENIVDKKINKKEKENISDKEVKKENISDKKVKKENVDDKKMNKKEKENISDKEVKTDNIEEKKPEDNLGDKADSAVDKSTPKVEDAKEAKHVPTPTSSLNVD